MKLLKENQTGIPTLAGARSDDESAGYVIPSFQSGAVIVQNHSGKTWRLSWEDPAQKVRRRALPAGDYSVRVYRLIRKDNAGKEWYISVTGHAIKSLSVQRGKETQLSLDETVTFRSGLVPHNDGVDVAMEFRGDNNTGLTLYENGKRVSVHYKIRGAKGNELAAGRMNFG